MTEMVWDFGIDRMPGQADTYELLPPYAEHVNCRSHFLADAKGAIDVLALPVPTALQLPG